MEIIHGYRDNKNLRDSFNALAEQTFDGLNFEGWYQNGFWGDNYDPYSIVVDGEVAANVSVNRTDFVIGGKRRKIYQLGTVMTAPEHRGKGLGRAIMESLEEILSEADGVYLFGNDSVVDYYPKFGFRPGREKAYSKAVAQSGPCVAKNIPMEDRAAWDRLAAAMERSEFRESCKMVGNPELIFFYVSQFMQGSVWQLPEQEAWVIADLEDGVLTIHNIFGGETLTEDAVIRSFGAEVHRAELAYAPEAWEGWDVREHREEDCNFFVRGPIFDEFEALGLRIPGLSHA